MAGRANGDGIVVRGAGGGAEEGAGAGGGAGAGAAAATAGFAPAPSRLTAKTVLQTLQRARTPAAGTFVGSTR